MLFNIQVCVREPLNHKDKKGIMAVEQASHASPRTKEEIFKKGNYILLADHKCKVVAFMVFRLHSTRVFLDDLVVHHDFRHKGIGTKMGKKLIDLIKSVQDGYIEKSAESVTIRSIRERMANQRCSKIDLYVRETNKFAIALFIKKLGFVADCVLREFYNKAGDTQEDAYAMRWYLRNRPITTAAVTNRIRQFFH